MIDLTPLDVRNKRGDFKKLLRGYDPQEVDTFLEMVSERLEDVVRENLRLQDRVNSLQSVVDSQSGREVAVQEALVSAQELRADIKSAAQRQAELIVAEAKVEARSLLSRADAQVRDQLQETERRLELGRDTMEEIERRRTRFLKNFRQLLERELEDLEVEERKEPVDQRPIDLELGRPKKGAPHSGLDSRADSAGLGAPEGGAVAEEVGAADDDDAMFVDEFPSLDASVDELADGYRGDAEKLFSAPEVEPRKSSESNLFSFTDGESEDQTEDDPRWG